VEYPLTAQIAIVDDDADVRSAIASLVRSAGYEARTYPSGEAFLAAPDRDGTRFLVVDMNMPGMSGLDLQCRLAEAGLPFPVVVITARPTTQTRAEALRRGAVAFFAKPFGDDELLTCIEQNI
jgi:FixJ family two-component response regulator